MKKLIQKLMGIALITATIIIISMAKNAPTTELQDGTAALLTAPLGLWLLFTKKTVIC